MKKNLLYTAIVLLLATLAGCSKSQTVVESREMVLRPVMATSPMGDMSEESDTKTDPDLSGTTLGTDNSYVIYTSASSEKYPAFMTGQLYSYITATSAWEASSSTGVADPEYWPLGGEYLDFLAYACKPAAQTALNTAPTALAWNTGQSANGFTITGWDTYDKQYDLMFAVANGRTAGKTGVVNLVFSHAMAVVGFTAVSTVADVFTINSITINGLEYAGTFTVDNSRTSLTAAWSGLTAADKVVYSLAGDTDPYDFVVPTSATQCTRHLLVPQQAAKSVTLNYTMGGADTDLDYTIRLPRTTWKAGYKYIYQFSVDPAAILISETVTDWDVNVQDIIIN